MTKQLLEAYENLNKSMQSFQNEYAKAIIIMQTAAKTVNELGEELEKNKQTFTQEQEEFDAHKETITEAAIQDYIEQSEGGDAEGYGPAENKNGG